MDMDFVGAFELEYGRVVDFSRIMVMSNIPKKVVCNRKGPDRMVKLACTHLGLWYKLYYVTLYAELQGRIIIIKNFETENWLQMIWIISRWNKAIQYNTRR